MALAGDLRGKSCFSRFGDVTLLAFFNVDNLLARLVWLFV